jgi:hypothetical protein
VLVILKTLAAGLSIIIIIIIIRHRLDAFFLTQVYSGSKFCPSVLEIVGLRVPAGFIRNFRLFSSSSSCKHSPSARLASAANDICRDVDVFAARHVLLNCLF